MKFKCKDCGQIYNEKPDYCDCGNNTFTRIMTKAEKEAEDKLKQGGSVSKEPSTPQYHKPIENKTINDNNTNNENNETDNEQEEVKEKENPFVILFAIVLFVAIVWGLQAKIHSFKAAEQMNENYITSVREKIMEAFDPTDITLSGFCVVSFEIDDEGIIEKRQFIQKASVEKLNKKVFDALKTVTLVDKPPKNCANKPIKLEFGCIANMEEVSCYSKNIIENQNAKQ